MALSRANPSVAFRALASLLLLAGGLLVAGCSAMGRESDLRLARPLRDDGVLAGKLGDDLSDAARAKAAEAEFRALESGQTGAPVVWKLSDTVYGSVVPQQPYSVGSINCRRYSHTISVAGENRAASGTACRQEDGSWRPLS